MKRNFLAKPRCVLMIGAAACVSSGWAADSPPAASEKVFETNVTNDPAISSGEPQIAIDPRNPRNLAIVEFGIGSTERPAYSIAGNSPEVYLTDVDLRTKHASRVMVSTDGGNTWTSRGRAIVDPNAPEPRGGAGDPYIAYGPDSTLYVGGETGPTPKSMADLGGGLTNAVNIFLTYSTDGGKTFPPAQSAGTPSDRPWLTVDSTTGDVYTASTGTMNLANGMHNIGPGPGIIADRWLVAWQPHLKGKSEPRRLGGSDFSVSGGSTITAAHGVIAATFALGGTPIGGKASDQPTPLPASLKSVVHDGTTSCSVTAPCLFFETSKDKGKSWSRHQVVVPGGFADRWVNVSADPGRAGRYAIAVLDSAKKNLLVLVTDDSGATWSGPVTVPKLANGEVFKQWMNYGPSGVLGVVWKDQRDDVPPLHPVPEGSHEVVAPAYDVYAAISCDGGRNWGHSIKVNAEVSPPGPAGHDDFTYVVLDRKYAHMVWGDRRILPKVTNVPGGFGGIQTYYGRVPFSVASGGKACGRQ